MVPDDPFDLDRFVRAQASAYDQAVVEITSGRKQTHWMWFIFPQVQGLGSSWNSVRYAISGIAEAEAYLAHPVLATRLVKCAEAALCHAGQTAAAIFGYTDALKLRSSATLFASVSPEGSVFHRIIDTFFQGQADETTLRLLQSQQRK